ncbi:MAG: hypothetical protein ACO3EE_08385 [Flavobacteriales bacterium]
MKKNILKLSYAALVGAVVMMSADSCKKKDDAPATNYNSPAEVLADLAPDMQSFTLDPTKDNVVTGEDGTVIAIPANAFLDKNGNAVQGSVTMDLKEILSLGDQLTSGVFAVSDGKLLSSGGEFYLKFTAGGQELTLADYKSIDVKIPADNVDTTMNVFTGNNVVNIPTENDSSGSIVNWQQSPDTTYNDSASYGDPLGLFFIGQQYLLKINELYAKSWYNIDHYLKYDEYTYEGNCGVVVGDNEEGEEIVLDFQFVYKKFNSVCGLSSYYSNVVSEANITLNGYWVKNQTATLVVIGVGKKTKKLYFGKATVLITPGVTPQIQLNSISKEALSSALNDL